MKSEASDHPQILRLQKHITNEAIAKLKGEMDGLFEQGIFKIAFDFGKVQLIDSLAISFFINLEKLLEKQNGHLCFFSVSEIDLDLFELLKVDKVVKIVPAEADALKFLGVKG